MWIAAQSIDLGGTWNVWAHIEIFWLETLGSE